LNLNGVILEEVCPQLASIYIVKISEKLNLYFCGCSKAF